MKCFGAYSLHFESCLMNLELDLGVRFYFLNLKIKK